MTYATEFYNDYIKRYNVKSFTHKDIIKETDANCPYGVLKHTLIPLLESLGYTIRVEKESRTNSKGKIKFYNRYYIEKEE